MAECDIIIPVWNQLGYTRRCIGGIKKNTLYPYNLILIDNNSEPATTDYLDGLVGANDNITVIKNWKNLGFVKAVNKGLRFSGAPYVVLMNNDTYATKGWLSKMAATAESDPAIGMVNPRSESPGPLSLERYSEELAKNKGEYTETNQCMGFCMLIKREVIDKVGHLDEAYGMGGFDDTDFSKRADREGYKCVCAKDAYVHHDWHTSFKKAGNREEIVRTNENIFREKWGDYLRIGYPIVCKDRRALRSDINTSLGMAREWNWVHAWMSSGASLDRELLSLKVPEHQSLRLFRMSGVKALFYLEVLFRLTERRLKGKKSFDAVVVSDRSLFRFLKALNFLFLTPVHYIGESDSAPDDTETSWRRRAESIAELIRKGNNI